MKRFFIPVSFIVALILAMYGQSFVLLFVPNTYTQTYKVIQSGMVQILSLGVVAFLLTSKSKGGGNFKIPHLRF